MRKILGLLGIIVFAAVSMSSCNDGKTYAEMMEEEKETISKFMSDSGFVSIDQYPSNGVFAENEFLLFSDGLYMNVVDSGNGEKFKDGDIVTVRFTEVNLSNQVIMSNMKSTAQGTNPDVFRYRVSGSSQSGTFIYENDSEYPLMLQIYQSTSVPSGWLVPLKYVRDGAFVKLIVPHKLGQSDAVYYVYPCYYEIQYGLSKR